MKREVELKVHRDIGLDNTKGFLIFFVVLGHLLSNRIFLSSNSDASYYYYLHVTIYSFHMPAFIFISGYFSRGSEYDRYYLEKLAKTLLIPFLVFNSIIWVFDSEPINNVLAARAHMWYLLSLFFWRLIVHPFSRIRCSFGLSIILAVAVGFSDLSINLSAARTVALFPFFLAGYNFKPRYFDSIKRLPKAFYIILIIASVFTVCVITYMNGMKQETAIFFTMAHPYSDTDLSPLQSMFMRLTALLIGFVIALSLIALTPSKESILSKWGRNTFSIYLIHGFVIKVLGKLCGLFPVLRFADEGLFIILSIAGACLLCFALANQRVFSMFNTAINRVSGMLIKPSDC